MRTVVEERRDDIGRDPVGSSRHPLPWRNQPSGGDNHVYDADGQPVYVGADAAEMFRLYGEEARAEHAERSAAGRGRVRRHRPGKGRRAV